jgi:hypothetical protein
MCKASLSAWISQNTPSVEIKQYVKKLRRSEVALEGTVRNIRFSKRGLAKLEVYVPIAGRPKHFIVGVVTARKDAGIFHKNDSVSCRGKFIRSNTVSLNGIVINGSGIK